MTGRTRALHAGKKFNRLLVLEDLPSAGGRNPVRCLCRCNCGVVKSFRTTEVVTGLVKSCRCYKKELDRAQLTTHGQSYTARYRSWRSMIDRCSNPNSKDYPRYGGRGIKICDRWLDFQNFIDDMGERPSKDHSIDRIDNNGGYTPENCRWADRYEQSNNRRSCRVETVGCVSLTIVQWERELGFPVHLIRQRLKLGWSMQEAISKPSRPRRSTKTSAL